MLRVDSMLVRDPWEIISEGEFDGLYCGPKSQPLHTHHAATQLVNSH